MKKIIFYLLMLKAPQHLQAMYDLNRPPQEVSFLGQEVHQAYGTTRYHENPYENSILGTVVHDEDRHLFNNVSNRDYPSSHLHIVTGEEYLTPLSPRTSNSNLTTILLSPRTSTALEPNSAKQCRNIAIIFLSAIGLGVIIGTTCYFYESLFNRK